MYLVHIIPVCKIENNAIINQLFSRYYMKVPEERLNMIDPVCELFPKMAACHYYRYGMGGIEDDRHSICVLGLNMINDKVFIGKKRQCKLSKNKVHIWFCKEITYFTHSYS